jgi:hypothetical protein
MRIVEVREGGDSHRFLDLECLHHLVRHHVGPPPVAIVSDVRRDGERLVGYGLNSSGRYAQSGRLRECFIPRQLAGAPEDLPDWRQLRDDIRDALE